MLMLAETMRHTWHQGGDLGDTRGWVPSEILGGRDEAANIPNNFRNI